MVPLKQRVPKFLCLGLIMRDILISGVPELPTHWEQTLVGKAVRSDTGGGAANSARTLGRLGAQVSLSGRIGKDSFAAQVKRDLEADAVDLSFLKEDADNPSGVAVALIRQDGKRCFTTVRGANQAYCEEDLASICWEAFPFVLVNGFFQFPALEPEISRSASVGEGHPKHIISEIAYAAGRKLLRQKIQRIGTVAHGLRRISGKAGIRFEYQLFQILGVNLLAVIGVKKNAMAVHLHLIGAVSGLKGEQIVFYDNCHRFLLL